MEVNIEWKSWLDAVAVVGWVSVWSALIVLGTHGWFIGEYHSFQISLSIHQGEHVSGILRIDVCVILIKQR